MHQRIYNELVRVEQAALRRGPRTRDGLMLRGLGDGTAPSSLDAMTPEQIAAMTPAQVQAYNDAMRNSAIDSYAAWVRSPAGIAWSVVATASMAASAYHGYKRNKSVGWALVWGAMGGLFPVITPVIAVAEGYAKPIRK